MLNYFIVAGKYGVLTSCMLTAHERQSYGVLSPEDYDPLASPSRDVRDAALFSRQGDAETCRFKVTDGKVFLCVKG